MASCEKCWEDSHGSVDSYLRLVRTRDCTPEQQAGRWALNCSSCGRKTIHQYAGVCVNPDCESNKEKP